MRKYQKMQAIIMCGALVASSTSVLAAKEASSEAKSESATEARAARLCPSPLKRL